MFYILIINGKLNKETMTSWYDVRSYTYPGRAWDAYLRYKKNPDVESIEIYQYMYPLNGRELTIEEFWNMTHLTDFKSVG